VEPAEDGVVLQWDSAAADQLYRVDWEKERPLGVTAKTQFKVFGVTPDESHCYRVVAIDHVGNVSLASIPACVGRPVERREPTAMSSVR
jgi:hypothetical protein